MPTEAWQSAFAKLRMSSASGERHLCTTGKRRPRRDNPKYVIEASNIANHKTLQRRSSGLTQTPCCKHHCANTTAQTPLRKHHVASLVAGFGVGLRPPDKPNCGFNQDVCEAQPSKQHGIKRYAVANNGGLRCLRERLQHRIRIVDSSRRGPKQHCDQRCAKKCHKE